MALAFGLRVSSIELLRLPALCFVAPLPPGRLAFGLRVSSIELLRLPAPQRCPDLWLL
jgi:hypothetical protein